MMSPAAQDTIESLLELWGLLSAEKYQIRIPYLPFLDSYLSTLSKKENTCRGPSNGQFCLDLGIVQNVKSNFDASQSNQKKKRERKQRILKWISLLLACLQESWLLVANIISIPFPATHACASWALLLFFALLNLQVSPGMSLSGGIVVHSSTHRYTNIDVDTLNLSQQ